MQQGHTQCSGLFVRIIIQFGTLGSFAVPLIERLGTVNNLSVRVDVRHHSLRGTF